MDQSVCFLGDSIVKGVTFDTEKGRYAILKDCFVNRIAQRCDLRVKNLSKFGSTVTDGLRRFEKQQEDLEDCAAVVTDFGGNDSDFNWSEVSQAPEAQHDPKTLLAVFAEEYCRLIASIRENGKMPILLNLPPVDHRKYFAWISRDLNGDNILKWLGGSSEFIYRWHEQYNLAVHRIAQATGAKLIDIRSAFLARRDFTALLCADGIHPNSAGHGLIAKTIYSDFKFA